METFYDLWGIMFEWLDMILAFGKKVVEIMSMPVGEAIALTDIGDTILTDILAWLTDTFLNDLSVIELLLTGGIAFYIGFIIVKFIFDVIF